MENKLSPNLSLGKIALQSENIVLIKYALPLIDQFNDTDSESIQNTLLKKVSPLYLKQLTVGRL